MKLFYILSHFLLVLLWPSIANAVVVYTDRTAWEIATGTPNAIRTETFTVSNPPFVFPAGTETTIGLVDVLVDNQNQSDNFKTRVLDPASIPGDDTAFFGSIYADPSLGTSEIQITFPWKTHAWGADFFDLDDPFSPGTLISFGDTLNFRPSLDALGFTGDGFLGFVIAAGESSFDRVIFTSAKVPGARDFNDGWGMDNLSFVPIPAALPLFASAVAGIGFMGWRRKRAATTDA